MGKGVKENEKSPKKVKKGHSISNYQEDCTHFICSLDIDDGTMQEISINSILDNTRYGKKSKSSISKVSVSPNCLT